MGMKFLDTNLLDHLQRPEFAELRGAFATRRHAARSLVFAPDTEENLVFIVVSGRVRVYLAYEDKEFNLGILGKGDIYSTHSGTFIEALEDTELLTTDVRIFRRRMTGIPEVTTTMVRVLGNILRNSFSIIDGLVFLDAGKRLSALLAHEARRGGEPQDGGLLLRMDLPVEQLARLVGASRQTVSTLLNGLARQGLIEIRARGQYFIPDLDKLEETALD